MSYGFSTVIYAEGEQIATPGSQSEGNRSVRAEIAVDCEISDSGSVPHIAASFDCVLVGRTPVRKPGRKPKVFDTALLFELELVEFRVLGSTGSL